MTLSLSLSWFHNPYRYKPRSSPQDRSRPHWARYRGGRHRQEAEERRARADEYVNQLERKGAYPDHVTSALREMDLEKIDLQLIVSLLRHISTTMANGAVLVFLPGWDTISKLHDMLKDDVMFNNSQRFVIIPLHSLMPTTTQKQVRKDIVLSCSLFWWKVFERPPPGVRKIIIATNIAETSITIDDVVYVVDCGQVKETVSHVIVM